MKEHIFLLYLFIVSWQDIKTCSISTRLLMIGGVFTWGVMIVQVLLGQGSWIQVGLGALPGILLLLVAWLTRKAGYADGIIVGYIGILWGYLVGFLVTCGSLLMLSLFSIILMMFGKVKKDTCIPYIPFLSAAFSLIVLIMGV